MVTMQTGDEFLRMGYSGVQFDPEKVDLYFESRAGKIKIIEERCFTGYSEEKLPRSCLRMR